MKTLDILILGSGPAALCLASELAKQNLNIMGISTKSPKDKWENTYGIWRKYIEPTELDLAWTGIPWRTSFQEGLLESGVKQKPMLMWAMNGHPLGCT